MTNKSLKGQFSPATKKFYAQATMGINRIKAAKKTLEAARTSQEISKAKKELELAEKSLKDLFEGCGQ